MKTIMMLVISLGLIAQITAAYDAISGTWTCTALDGKSITNRYVSMIITFSTNGVYRNAVQQEPGVTVWNEDMYRVDGEYIRFGKYTDDTWNFTGSTTTTNHRTGVVTIDQSRAAEAKKNAIRFAVTNDILKFTRPSGSVSEYRRGEHRAEPTDAAAATRGQ